MITEDQLEQLCLAWFRNMNFDLILGRDYYENSSNRLKFLG